MKGFYNILKIIVWCIIGVFVGGSIYQYYDYTKHLDLYAMTSAPWYLSIQIRGVFTVIIVVILLIVMWLVKKKIK